MVHVVDFRSPVRRTNARSANARPGSAEIVIFPGVRYERWANDMTPSHAITSRDRIELPD